MTNAATKRIQREYADLKKSDMAAECAVGAELVDSNYLELQGIIKGPPQTPYAGGTFLLHIQIPHQYPFYPPKVRFISSIWHPNISSVTGLISLDILTTSGWVPSMTLTTTLLSIQAMLSAAEPDDPQDGVVARQYRMLPQLFHKTAEHWTGIYANGPTKHEEFELAVKSVQEALPGTTAEDARRSLSNSDWVLDRAVDNLLL